jgi:hypothetical protein
MERISTISIVLASAFILIRLHRVCAVLFAARYASSRSELK